jgi:hypothetical protein
MASEMVEVNREDLEEFKKRYEQTSPNGVFKFKGRVIIKEYAKYLIEYLEQRSGEG